MITANKLFSSLSQAVYTGFACKTIYHLLDDGLSRLLALETLTHGTGPYGYLGINARGADPSFCGSNYGSIAGLRNSTLSEYSKNYFYLFKDSEFQYQLEFCAIKDPKMCIIGQKLLRYIKSVFPKRHAVLSGTRTFVQLTPMLSTKNRLLEEVLGGVCGLMTPTLKFRFALEEVQCTDDASQSSDPDQCGICRFENDPDYHGLAYRTSESISPMHLGITGSLSQGLNSKALVRMTRQPGTVLYGGVLCMQALGIAYFAYRFQTKFLPNLLMLPNSLKERVTQVGFTGFLLIGLIYNIVS